MPRYASTRLDAPRRILDAPKTDPSRPKVALKYCSSCSNIGLWVDFWVTFMPESDVVMTYEHQRLASQPRHHLDAPRRASTQPRRSLDATERHHRLDALQQARRTSSTLARRSLDVASIPRRKPRFLDARPRAQSSEARTKSEVLSLRSETAPQPGPHDVRTRARESLGT